MSPRISIVPASTQASRETIRTLLSAENPPYIDAIYRDSSKAPPEFTKNPNFNAIKGNISLPIDLDFTNSDAVFYIPPPTYDGTDSAEFAAKKATNIKTALENAPSVKRLLMFSAVGSQHDEGIGILVINHISDKILKDAAPEVVIVRPGYFQEIWAEAFETMKAEEPFFYSPMTPADHKIVMISLHDIGKKCGRSLLKAGTALPSQPYILQLRGPRSYSTQDVQSALKRRCILLVCYSCHSGAGMEKGIVTSEA